VTLDYSRSAASTPFYGSATLDLSAFRDASGNGLSGRIVLNGVFAPGDLHASDFIFSSGADWHEVVPAELLPLI
jgi:hypothetical protein